MTNPTEGWQPWDGAATATGELRHCLVPLHLNPELTTESARRALSNFYTRGNALAIIGQLDTEFTKPFIDELLNIALAERDTLWVRNILGRLPYGEAKALVPNGVWRLLDREHDMYAYRRMAELLDHLGLETALGELCQRAAASVDLDTREVADDFS